MSSDEINMPSRNTNFSYNNAAKATWNLCSGSKLCLRFGRCVMTHFSQTTLGWQLSNKLANKHSMPQPWKQVKQIGSAKIVLDSTQPKKPRPASKRACAKTWLKCNFIWAIKYPKWSLYHKKKGTITYCSFKRNIAERGFPGT